MLAPPQKPTQVQKQISVSLLDVTDDQRKKRRSTPLSSLWLHQSELENVQFRRDSHPTAQVKEDGEDPNVTSAKKYQLGFSHFKEKWQKLDQQMYQQKNLINMIIHDLRCPTAQIKHAAGNQLSSLEGLREEVELIQEFFEEDKSFLEQMERAHESLEKLKLTGATMATELQGGTEAERLTRLRVSLEESMPCWTTISDRRMAQSFIERIDKIEADLAQQSRPGLERPRANTEVSRMQAFHTESSSSSNTDEEQADSSDDEANASFDSERSNTVVRVMTLSQNYKEASFAPQPRLIEEVASRNLKLNTSVLPTLENLRSPDESFLTEAVRNRDSFFTSMAAPMLPSKPQRISELDKLEFIITNLRNKFENTLQLKALSLLNLNGFIDAVAKMTSSCEYSSAVLLNLINDLLDLAKAENNAFSISNNFFSLEQAIKEADYTLNFMAEQRKIVTSVEIKKIDSFKLRAIFGDSGRLKQVIVNLMSNALKFTDEGGKVQVWAYLDNESQIENIEHEMAHLQGDTDQFQNQQIIKYDVRIEVKDNGQGISQEGQAKLFKNYTSLNEHKARNERGTGLGLCICKQIVERMGGSISVDSTVGKGTTFTIRIPFMSLNPRVEQRFADKSRNPSLSIIPSEAIREEEVSDKSDGNSVSDNSSSFIMSRQKVKSFTQNSVNQIRVPNQKLSITSLQVPMMKPEGKRDSISMAVSKVKLSKPKKMSTFCFPRKERKSAHDVEKSVDLQQIENPIFFTKNNSMTRSINHGQWSHLKILIVNDEPVGLMILEQMFRDQLGFEKVETASNGQVAVNKSYEQFFDIILMDLHMPVLDGFEATRQIKENVLNHDTVMVALSASSFTEDLVQQCRDAGFQTWMTSPLKKEAIITDILEEHFSEGF